jgi:hypothetical protein
MVTMPRWLRARLLVRAACGVGLVALASIAAGVLFPYALPVVFAMSVGQGLGALAFVCYLLAIVAEVLEHEAARRALGGRPPGKGM